MNKLVKLVIILSMVFMICGGVSYKLCSTIQAKPLVSKELVSNSACRVIRRSMSFKTMRIVRDNTELKNYSYMDSDNYIVTLVDDETNIEYNIGSEKYYNIFSKNTIDRDNIQVDMMVISNSSRIVDISNVEETGYNE